MITKADLFVLFFAVLLLLIGISLFIPNGYIYNTKIYYKEVYSLRCDNINAIGCTTYLGFGNYLIEYVPDSQRCKKEGCITINDTIKHELNHVTHHKFYGYFDED